MGPHSCPTVFIKTEKTSDNPTGVVMINLEDFNKETMELAEEVAVESEAESEAEPVVPVVAAVVAPWAK